MTKTEKFKAIVDRLGPEASQFQPIHLSVLVLIEYMDILFKNGLLSTKPIDIAESGNAALEVCKEFDWTPDNNEIASFCKEFVEPAKATAMVMALISFRDDKENFLKNAKKHIDLDAF